MEEGLRIHGGACYYDKNIRLDFSVNTNPLADVLPKEIYLAGERALKKLYNYPSLRYERLASAIAAYEGMEKEMVLCGNGASELFMAISNALSPKTAAVFAPCFSGYEWALKASGDCVIRRYYLSEKNDFSPDEGILSFLSSDMDILFLAHPNNPTGRKVNEELLFEILTRCSKLSIIPVIDICFLDIAGSFRFPAWKQNAFSVCPDVILVNAFTKTMSLPGARIGYLLTKNDKLLSRIERALPEWNMSLIAEEMGEACADYLRTTDFLKRSRLLIDEQRCFVERELELLGIRTFTSNANFILIKSEVPLAGALLNRGILIRDCGSFEGLDSQYARIAIKGQRENEILLEAIGEIMSGE